jgi:UDP-N-acetylmuramoyl-tripeptide--D-alanyl-D-alanine ligase
LGPAVARLSEMPILPGRLARLEREGILVLDDSYNANPASLQAAVEVLAQCRRPGRKVLVIGDMLELGERSEWLHAEAGRRIGRAGVELLIGVGPLSRRLVSGAVEAGLPAGSVRSFDRPEEAGLFLWEWARRGDVVLVKGSRGMRMERVLECSITFSTR